MADSKTKHGWRADKLDHLGSSIFAEVAAWKEEALQAGKDVIDLGIGSPDRGPTQEVREVLSKAVLAEDSYAYPSSSGSPAFRKQAAAWMAHRFGVTVDPETELLALMGSQDGLAHLAQAICNPGDMAIVPDPGYPIYVGALAIAGVKPYLLPLRQENGFLPDLDEIADEVWAEAVFILLNFPGNPIAVQAEYAFFEKLIALAKKWNVLVVHDLAYSEMGFDNYRPLSILQLPGALDTAVEFHSFSKSFNMAGCRIGFLAGNREAVGALRKLKGNIDYGVFEPIQTAAIAALKQAMERPAGDRGVAPLYERRRDAFVEVLAAQGWDVPKPKATMFLWAPLPERFRMGPERWSSRRFARELLLSTGVAVIPGDAFGAQGEGFVRIALVQEEATLLEAARRIGTFLDVLFLSEITD
ncbi:aminotransferase class I/II-fold pyridoxal phosphate-dependent enzyme [Paenibacillus sp. P96]|uniref:Aminotransferase n=1 Tax=Paenibacillus zeirhizosphaerae TaxID=2987519 RepID=A0ABT9FTP8_9BACL|nr:aminotransferase class I/II-fold pyridoxal phosphate-dependent enzyme [Paenibacillus sp. P96]MDP4098121.1 aminotransferase class I/II-fold pyridoxal phosphate-dependent enzyme [Paenibacillus sp. P96]